MDNVGLFLEKTSTLDLKDQKIIEEMLREFSSDSYITLEQMWLLIDKAWDKIGCDNRNLEEEKITAFYKHPIWLLNGFFIEQHDVSLQHRHAISNWIIQNLKTVDKTVLDFGGGFGTLARMIAKKSSLITIDIYEPYPSNFAISQCSSYSSINFVSNLNKRYKCLVSTDVLEHVSDPLDLFWRMIQSVDLNGYLIIANCFHPVIKCHLPATFHFRYSFDQFAVAMGLEIIGACEGSHATIYKKIGDKDINWHQIRKMELRSQNFYKFREFKQNKIYPWKHRLKRLITDPVGLVNSLKDRFS